MHPTHLLSWGLACSRVNRRCGTSLESMNATRRSEREERLSVGLMLLRRSPRLLRRLSGGLMLTRRAPTALLRRRSLGGLKLARRLVGGSSALLCSLLTLSGDLSLAVGRSPKLGLPCSGDLRSGAQCCRLGRPCSGDLRPAQSPRLGLPWSRLGPGPEGEDLRPGLSQRGRVPRLGRRSWEGRRRKNCSRSGLRLTKRRLPAVEALPEASVERSSGSTCCRAKPWRSQSKGALGLSAAVGLWELTGACTDRGV